MAAVVRAARGLLARRPVLSNAAAGGALAGVADAAAQFAEHGSGAGASSSSTKASTGGKAGMQPLERWISMVVWGGATGLVYPPLYRRLDRWFSGLVPKVCFQQFCVSPIYNSVFLGYIESVQGPVGTAWPRICRRIESDLLHVLQRSLPFWMSVNAFNFHLVPLSLRSVTMNSINCLWTMYLSWLVHRKLQQQKA
mmetsp:Transcript_5634/g.18198  ORF Transcript_5634/g.18198 Transcript_5634/m.18198 type:complete len:196 (+) Transcript_5634:74-661(+)